RGINPVLEKHHKVQLLDDAIEAAVKLSHRYIPSRQLPDKAVSLIDTACARVAIGHHAVPAEVEDCRRRIQYLETEIGIVKRESAMGVAHGGRGEELAASLEAEKTRLTGLEERWEKERDFVNRILDLRARLVAANGQGGGDGKGDAKTDDKSAAAAAGAEPPADPAALLAEVRELESHLENLQGDHPLIQPSVNGTAVASVVADWTGIPVGRMVKDEVKAVLELADLLERRVIGQRHAMEAITKRIQTSRASLDNPNKPIGVFLLAGTSGVGKTETALALAESLYGGEHNLITINMSEFQEAHTVSTLKGSPPGYVGYGEGGVLTEAVRRRPYSVVLLDEVEKAHPDVHELFFQVFDKGAMEDGEGREIDFRNCIILLTTNAGSDLIMSLCKDPDLMPDPDSIVKALREPLLKVFPAALLGRMITLAYYPLSDEVVRKIIRLQLDRIRRRVQENHRVPFTYTDDVVDLVASRCTEVESGGRMIDAILTNTLLPAISHEFLQRVLEGKVINRVEVIVEEGDFGYRFD
ncbi:MAG: AAA family ATPase, partial [Puniceicoccaceae bacterium]